MGQSKVSKCACIKGWMPGARVGYIRGEILGYHARGPESDPKNRHRKKSKTKSHDTNSWPSSKTRGSEEGRKGGRELQRTFEKERGD